MNDTNSTVISLLPPRRVLNLSTAVYILLFLLGLWGCMSIYNATFHSDYPFYFAGRQFAWLMIGMVVLFSSSKLPFRFYKQAVLPIAAAAFVPLVAVLFFGTAVHGMRGWFSIGSIFIQPSEFAKGPFILLLSCIAANIGEFDWKRFLILLGVALMWMLPIALEPDLGTLAIYFAGFVTVYWVCGGNLGYLMLTFLMGLPVSAIFIYKYQYVIPRLIGFLNPDTDPMGSGWHIRQFQYALARGGFWGTSWGKALWANSYLPLSHSDSAFAALTESVGFIGAFPVIVGLALLAYISYRLSCRAQAGTDRIFIFSMGMLFSIQALVHISVNVTMIPPTGITLPILSYGGSSLVSTMFAFGMILSAAAQNQNNYDIPK